MEIVHGVALQGNAVKDFKHILSGVPAVLALATDVTKSVASVKTAGYLIGKLFTALPTGDKDIIGKSR